MIRMIDSERKRPTHDGALQEAWQESTIHGAIVDRFIAEPWIALKNFYVYLRTFLKGELTYLLMRPSPVAQIIIRGAVPLSTTKV